MTVSKRRTFGWIQNPGSLESLRNVVEIFYKNTEHYNLLKNYRLPLLLKNSLIEVDKYKQFLDILSKDEIVIPYDLAKGKGIKKGEKRCTALCTGVVQATLDSQKYVDLIDLDGKNINIKKLYCDDWTTDGYLRWAISTGLLEYNRFNDTCNISELGKELIFTNCGSKEEKEVLSRALLSYPPVYRVLTILSDHNAHTKFEIGELLGFKGELGFSSIPQEVYVYDYCAADNSKSKSEVRNNLEGDSDKYARMIANWLVKMNWAIDSKKKVTENYYGNIHTMTMYAWKITRDGEKAIERSNGKSSNAKIPKIVKFEMLASKISDAEYVRFRRANILRIIEKSKTLNQIQIALKEISIDESLQTIKDDIDNFINIGLRIIKSEEKYKLIDKIVGLEIPIKNAEVSKNEITVLKENIREKLKSIDHKFLILLDLAYSDAATKNKKNFDAKNFEIETANLFSKELGIRAERLGDSNKPDVLIEYGEYGTIIDNKSYKNGFVLGANLRDEMARYIEQNQLRKKGVPSNEWWKWFDCKTDKFTYLFVTSYIRGKFKEQLDYIHNIRDIYGAGIGICDLLLLVDDIKSNKLSIEDFFMMFKDDEIIYMR